MEHVRDARVLPVLMGRVLNQMGLLDHISVSLDDGPVRDRINVALTQDQHWRSCATLAGA